MKVRMTLLVETEGKGKTMSDDDLKWAEESARRIAAQRQQSDTERRMKLADQELVKTAAPDLWQKTREALKRRVMLLNKAAQEDVLLLVDEPDTITIQAHPGGFHQVVVEFDPEQAAIRCMLVNASGDYNVRAMSGQAVLTEGNQYLTPTTPDKIAKHVLDHLVSFIR